MARKYARDNRGRFASKGAGATARGGRLKTAGGNKREGQTIKVAGEPAGTVGAKAPSTGALQKRASRGDKAAMGRLNARRATGRIGKEPGFGPKADTPPLRANGTVRQRMQAASSKPAGTMAGKVKRDPNAAGKAASSPALGRRRGSKISVPTTQTNFDKGRRGIASMSPRAKSVRSQNVKELATEKGKGVMERASGAEFRRKSRETSYNAPGSAGAKRIARTAATKAKAIAYAQAQIYGNNGGSYRGHRPEFAWKRSRRPRQQS